MRFAPELAGPADPLDGTPQRPAGSARRTTSIDVSRPRGVPGPLLFDARGRDLVTCADGSAYVASAAGFEVDQDEAGHLGEFDLTDAPAAPGALDLGALAGATPASGFRKTLAAAGVPDADPGGLWHLLLDDMVGARIVSGLAQQYEETLAGGGPMHEGIYADTSRLASHQGDICAGWATDATMLRELDESGMLPVSMGPPAPNLEADDPAGWHRMRPLAPHSVRRRRRLDVGPADRHGISRLEVHFRDSHADGDGVERVVHEYLVTGHLDVPGATITGIEAQSRVLPWPECPRAEASAGRVVGVPLGGLREFVRHELLGVSTCTHLNDVLRSLADLGTIASALTAEPPGPAPR